MFPVGTMKGMLPIPLTGHYKNGENQIFLSQLLRRLKKKKEEETVNYQVYPYKQLILKINTSREETSQSIWWFSIRPLKIKFLVGVLARKLFDPGGQNRELQRRGTVNGEWEPEPLRRPKPQRCQIES